jgi:lysozyme
MIDMKTSAAGIKFISLFEGFRSKPYKDSGGVWTIGFGETHGITANTPPITMEQGIKLLANSLSIAEAGINKYINVDISQNMFDSLSSAVFNCGTGFVSGGVGKLINANKAPDAIWLSWCNVKGVKNQGLLNRRIAELKIFHTASDSHPELSDDDKAQILANVAVGLNLSISSDDTNESSDDSSVA